MTPTTRPPTESRGSAAAANDDLSGKWLAALILGSVAIVAVLFFGLIGAVVAFANSDQEALASTTLSVNESEFRIGGQLTAPAGEVDLEIFNSGNVVHNVVARDLGLRSKDVGPGGTVDLSLGTLSPGEYELVCDIAGHEAAGMVATLTITGSGEVAAGAFEEEEPDYAAMDAALAATALAFPAETEGRGNPILEPTEIEADGTKVFDLTVAIVDWEVEPGRFVDAWTYNGVVPAPQFILDRGDKIKVRVLNNLPMGTDIHWHGVRTPNGQDGVAPITQELIPANGGTFQYEFTVEDDSIGMYHSHNHAQIQVLNGMLGVFRVGELPIPRGVTISGVTLPDDLEVAVDIPMVLNDAGTIGYSLNGKSFPATEPVVVKQGDWVNVTYYNEGLQIHPMHLHQFPQLVYAKDGIPLDKPYWADTVNVAPGERYTVLFRANDAGTWVWHCHILTHVERESGLFGMLTAVVVEEDLTFDPDLVPINPTDFQLTPAGTDPTEIDPTESAIDESGG